MKHYEILSPISPERGPVIFPAGEEQPPVILSEDDLFASPSDLPNARRAAILIALGDIRELPSDAAMGGEIAASVTLGSEPDAPETVIPIDDDGPEIVSVAPAAPSAKRKRDA